METLAATQFCALAAALTLGFAILAQFLVLDIAGIRSKHVPGTPVTGGHDDFLFRAARAHANTSENLGLYLLSFFCALLLGADPRWTAGAAWTFTAARIAHMGCYYADLRMARSVSFAIGLLAQVALLLLCAVTLFQHAH
ncbi:MAG TPA: MAPEG family protein [Solimonas sp.]|nr:MAPEG family protein [Solimonas sp.]